MLLKQGTLFKRGILPCPEPWQRTSTRSPRLSICPESKFQNFHILKELIIIWAFIGLGYLEG